MRKSGLGRLAFVLLTAGMALTTVVASLPLADAVLASG